MAWNPSPEVAHARDFGKKFNYDRVIIIGVNDTTQKLEVVSYGSTKKKCDEVKQTADEVYNQILNGDIVFNGVGE